MNWFQLLKLWNKIPGDVKTIAGGVLQAIVDSDDKKEAAVRAYKAARHEAFFRALEREFK